MGELCVAVRDSILLSFFFGLFCHNLYWFNWLWSAAFALMANHFAFARANFQPVEAAELYEARTIEHSRN
jgi:hypothetical protein